MFIIIRLVNETKDIIIEGIMITRFYFIILDVYGVHKRIIAKTKNTQIRHQQLVTTA